MDNDWIMIGYYKANNLMFGYKLFTSQRVQCCKNVEKLFSPDKMSFFCAVVQNVPDDP